MKKIHLFEFTCGCGGSFLEVTAAATCPILNILPDMRLPKDCLRLLSLATAASFVAVSLEADETSLVEDSSGEVAGGEAT